MSSDRRRFLREIAGAAREVRGVSGAGRDAFAEARAALLRGDLPEETVREREPDQLSPAERERYVGHLELEGWSIRQQLALRRASVLLVGAGAIGSSAALSLVGAGVGRLGVVDAGRVQTRELSGEPLHFTPDLGVPKARSAVAKLGFLNPEVEVVPYEVRLDAENAPGLLAGHDLVLDASNRDATRSALNAACIAAGTSLVAANAGGLGGWVMVVTGESACLRCAFPEGPASDGGKGGLGAVTGVVGSLQALEALKLLTGFAPPLTDALLQIELGSLEFTRVNVSRRPGCPDCGEG